MFVLFGHVLGISSELALAVSMAKRLREVLCGVPALFPGSWRRRARLAACGAWLTQRQALRACRTIPDRHGRRFRDS